MKKQKLRMVEMNFRTKGGLRQNIYVSCREDGVEMEMKMKVKMKVETSEEQSEMCQTLQWFMNKPQHQQFSSI